ncbi:GGDEF domain-containing protein [Oleispirillum naphthae]|uniref:GGDEF domain-containing protein n=1 Tax=Oleispirillum naphthae TaxID=2838853 RepID=UPI003082348D
MVILSGTLISATFYLFGIRPLSDLLRSFLAAQISHNLEDGMHAVDAVFTRHRDLAAQVASRSVIRSRQIDFLQGRIGAADLAAFAAPKLADAVRSSTEIVGIVRHAPDGRFLFSVGEAIPETLAADCLSLPLTEPRPLPMTASPLRFAYCSPIRDARYGLVGFDVIAAATDAVQQAIDALDRPMASFALASRSTDIAFRQTPPAHEAAMTALSLFLTTGRGQPGYVLESAATGVPGLSLFTVVDQEGFYEQIRDKLRTLLITLGVAASIILAAAVVLLKPVIRALLDEQRLIEMATYDMLTGLLNWGAFHSTLDREMERARRYRHPLSLILFDIDFFKRVNDTHGHPVGDEVLREIGRVCPRLFRRTDISARYGGEEFAVILPETGEPHAGDLADRLRLAIADAPVATAAGPIAVTVSAGVLTWRPAQGDVTKAELIAKADAALYASKAAGRNRVTAAAFEA